MNQLYYAPLQEITRVRSASCPAPERIAILADINRINTLYMIAKAGSGHIGTCFSCMDILTLLWEDVLQQPNQPETDGSDLFFSSKGHDAPALYALMLAHGLLPFESIHQLRRLGGLPGHPDVGTPGVITNTGSLGMGVSKARGMALARRLRQQKGRIFVLTGDGELQEGQFWESLQPTANQGFGEITVLVDHNKIQSDTFVNDVSGLGALQERLAAYGWETARCDGHDFHALRNVLEAFSRITDKPKICIADTVKGRGVSFMSRITDTEFGPLYRYHSGAPAPEDYDKALAELTDQVNAKLQAMSMAPLALVSGERTPQPGPANPQKLVAAYGEELLELGGKRKDLVALDADLALDCGLLPFRQAYPERFVECGIAEQDMVSSAGGLARLGLLPVVHSFACFLAPRPNEQIFNNATEHSKIIYAGSLAGVVPGGPGHSHQSVRDIAILAATPGLTLIEPCDAAEARAALRWAVQENPESTYIRLVSIPCDIPYTQPENHPLMRGRGATLRHGKDVLVIGYGPVLLPQAWHAAEILEHEHGISVRLENLPWLNAVDPQWLQQTVQGHDLVLLLDNHLLPGGQGQMLAAEMAAERGGLDLERMPRVLRLGLDTIPACGWNSEVLAHHGLDAASIVKLIASNYNK